jgi:hypothetical protein
MKNLLGCLSVAALAVVLAAPLPAQSVGLKANVPFDFVVGGRTLPAGSYDFGLLSRGGVLRVMSESGSASAMTASRVDTTTRSQNATKIEFHRYGNEYFLYRVCDGGATNAIEVPVSRTERELSARASLNRPETVMVLARR